MKIFNEKTKRNLNLQGIRAFGGGSLTSGQPVVRQQQPQHQTPTCPYCQVPFPNEAGLQCHELRCSKRIELEKAKEAPPAPEATQPEQNNRHPLKRRLLAAAVPDDLPQNQAKLARKVAPCKFVVYRNCRILVM